MTLIPVDGHPGLARNKATAAIININSSEIAQARKEAEARMTEQTEKLRQQNAEERNLREWRARNNLNVGTGTPNF